jgi:hypothetical protein
MMLEFLRGKVSERKLRLFAAACTRCFWQYLVREPSRRAVEVAEQFADGLADQSVLQSARIAAEVVPGQLLTKMNYPLSAFAAAECTEADAWEAASRASSAILDAALPLVAHTTDGQVLEAVAVLREFQGNLLRDIFGNPFHPLPPLLPTILTWHDRTIPRVAEGIYAERAFKRMPILHDALLDAGCADEALLSHCRNPEGHVRGCWTIDLILSKDR